MSRRKRHLLAALAAQEIHLPADHDLTTTDLVESFPEHNGQEPADRKTVVRLLRILEDDGYVVARQRRLEFHSGWVITWHITTRGLRVALGGLT